MYIKWLLMVSFMGISDRYGIIYQIKYAPCRDKKMLLLC